MHHYPSTSKFEAVIILEPFSQELLERLYRTGMEMVKVRCMHMWGVYSVSEDNVVILRSPTIVKMLCWQPLPQQSAADAAHIRVDGFKVAEVIFGH